MTYSPLRDGRLRPLLFAAAALLALGAAAITPSEGRGQTDTVALEDFHGTWQLSGGQRDLEDGIDRVVDELNLFVREIARLEMRRRITPERQIRIDVNGDQVQLAWDGWGPHPIPLTGSRRIEGPQGERIRASLRLQNGRLVHHHRASNGNRFTTYQLGSDRSQMTMGVRITSDQLPVDIRYRLQYRRR